MHHFFSFLRMADNSGTSEATGSGSTTEGNARQQTGSLVLTYMLWKKIDSVMWITRIFTIICTFLFFFPLVGGGPYEFYQRALISNALTNAIRLHRIYPNFHLNCRFLSLLLAEDSCHYLIYSLMFIVSYPLTMSLIPICLYAVLHACNFTADILYLMEPQSIQFVRNMITKVKAQHVSILVFIACPELFIMPAVILMAFFGKCSKFLPIIYYRFLLLRLKYYYPIWGPLFHRNRVTIEYLCNNPQSPDMVRYLSTKIIAFFSRLAPTVE
ncbi:transmembrane protein 33-like [Mytilus galloprovincialis]|uniref:transmembrane protein 33-like n=1 Tax=Mytilus galloprovincialis TaxID=29158 RepID=UPI003F7C5F3D